MKSYKILAVFVAVLAGSFTACKKSSFKDTPSQVSLYQIISDDYQFGMFRYAVDRLGMKDMLEGSGSNVTLIAPTNQAFLDMGFGINGNTTLPTLEKLTNDELEKLVKNHILPGRVDLTTINGNAELTTMNMKVKATKKDKDYYINGGDITHMGVNATNGYLYVVNRVILPQSNPILKANLFESLKARTNFTFLVAAINKASQAGTNYVDLLSGQTPYTLFAPDNNAFTRSGLYPNLAAVTAAPAADLSALLARHILPGTKFTSDLDSIPVNTYNGTAAQFDRYKLYTGEFVQTQNYVNGVTFSSRGNAANNLHPNGSVYHTVSQLLPNPVTVSTLAYIKADPTLSYFDAAIDEASKKAGMTVNFVELLSGTSASHTVYAPTNDAFIAAGYATVADVRAIAIGRLTNLLKYHMVKRRMASWTIGDGASVPTLLTTLDASKNPVPVSFTATVTGGYVLKGKNNTTATPVTSADVVTTTGLINKIAAVLSGE